jgi:LacI family transcriptional regulator
MGTQVAPKPANILDIAKLAGVSRSTVSRVLNNHPDVNEKTRAKVLSVVARANFIPHFAAAMLAGHRRRTDTVGMLVPDLGSYWATEILRGIGDAAAAKYDLILYTTNRSVSKQTALWRALRQRLVAGVILILPAGDDEELRKVLDSAVPVVIVDHEGKETTFPSVVCENVRTSAQLTQHLLNLGHVRIGFINGPKGYGLAQERFLGFASALYEAGIETKQDYVVNGDFTERGGFEAARLLLHTEPRPTAIVSANDEMAFGAIKAIKAAGLRVPRDFSVVGFDDVPAAHYSDPGITTARQPLFEMGHVAMQLLEDQLSGRTMVAKTIILPSSIVIRESCAPPPTENGGCE